MIRLPRSSLYALTSRLQATNSSRLGTAEEQASTGRRINRPSDASADLFEAHQLSAAMSEQDAWHANAESAAGELDGMDSALAQASDIIVRAREIAVQMSSESWNAADRTAAAKEVRGLQESMATAANASSTTGICSQGRPSPRCRSTVRGRTRAAHRSRARRSPNPDG